MPTYHIHVIARAAGSKDESAKIERLVSAKTEAAALKHVVSDTITIDRASVADAVRLGAAGIEIEQAGE